MDNAKAEPTETKTPDIPPSTSGPAPDLPDAPPVPVERSPAPAPTQQADPAPADVNQTSAPTQSETPLPRSPAHIARSPTPPRPNDAPSAPAESASEMSAPEPAPAPTTPAAPATTTPATPQTSGAPAPPPGALTYPPTNIPLTMVQSSPENGQTLTARQLGQRARRARERELQAQGLYTPKRRTSSSATQPDLASYGQLTQPQTQATPVQADQSQGDVTMQSADEDGDDDGEGEPETDLVTPATTTPATGSAAPAVPPHPASHLIPPIAVLAPTSTPSRASLAQRARRERERQARLGGLTDSPGSTTNGSPAAPTYVVPPASNQPIPFNAQQPPTLTRGQLAQRARRARERVERAAKTTNSDGWTPSLGAQEGGVSSAGEAVFAVAPPTNGTTTAFATTISQTNPGYGVGLGAAHVPQQLNRAQLAQRARRARERQQRVAAAGAHASGTAFSDDGKNSTKEHRSPSSSVPPASPTAKRHLSDASRTSLSPMASSTTSAPLNIGAQFNEVFKSLTAGDNGVSRAVADAGALTSKDDKKPNSHSPATAKPESRDMDVDAPAEDVDQLIEDAAPAAPTSKSEAPKPEAAAPTNKPEAPKSAPAAAPAPEPQPKPPTPEVPMTVQSVGA